MSLIKKIILKPKNEKALGIKVDGVQFEANTVQEANRYQVRKLIEKNQYRCYEVLEVNGNTYHIPLSLANYDKDNTAECTFGNLIIGGEDKKQSVPVFDKEQIPVAQAPTPEQKTEVVNDKVEIKEEVTVTPTFEENSQEEIINDKVEVAAAPVVEQKQVKIQQPVKQNKPYANNKNNSGKQQSKLPEVNPL